MDRRQVTGRIPTTEVILATSLTHSTRVTRAEPSSGNASRFGALAVLAHGRWRHCPVGQLRRGQLGKIPRVGRVAERHWVASFVALCIIIGGAWHTGTCRVVAAAPEVDDVKTYLEQLIQKADSQSPIPSLSVAVFDGEQLLLRAAAGVRQLGNPTPVAVDDVYHWGSITKPMTATLVAMAVEEGRLEWSTTLPQALRKLDLPWAVPLEEVTVERLLQQRTGLASEVPTELWRELFSSQAPGPTQRITLLRSMVRQVEEPTTKFRYANVNYALAGVILEETYDQPWEELIRRKLFQPLGMSSAGLGVVGRPGPLQQPWAHRPDGTPVEPGPGADNPPAIGPGGAAHGSCGDLARFGQLHLRAGRAAPQLLEPATFARLHSPPVDSEYACGWVVADRPWAQGTALHHSGSNTLNYAVLWLAPQRNWGVAVATNIGGPQAAQACDDVASEMIRLYLPK